MLVGMIWPNAFWNHILQDRQMRQHHKFQGISLEADKLHAMQVILYAKAECCKDFRDVLLESRVQNLVETVRSDRFWSCGLIPSEAQTTKPIYNPGDNHLGRLLELVRAHLIKQLQNNKNSKKISNLYLRLHQHW